MEGNPGPFRVKSRSIRIGVQVFTDNKRRLTVTRDQGSPHFKASEGNGPDVKSPGGKDKYKQVDGSDCLLGESFRLVSNR